MNRIVSIILVIIVALAFSCKKAPEAQTGSNKISIGTTTVDSVVYVKIAISAVVNALGGNLITQHGFCWGTSPNPDINGSHSFLGSLSNTGKFSEQIAGLSPTTKYYVRPYLTYKYGTFYGQQVEATTQQLTTPSVITENVTDINYNSASVSGAVSNDGGSAVTKRGVCWNTTGNPTLANSIGHTTDGTGTGSFTSNITGLSHGTTYYVTAYATNEKGTAYSTVIKQFLTLTPFVCGATVSHGGKSYQTVQIGTQCWFRENLNIGTRINGNQDQINNGIIEKYCYDDNEANCNTYGGLYQWDELMQYVATQGAKGLCPDGWHIPTDAEWTTLTTSLGGESVAGGKMKEVDTTHWASPNSWATNSSGFTALPGCSRNASGFPYGLTYIAYFWSSTEYSFSHAWYRSLIYYNEVVDRYGNSEPNGFSCRCLQD